MQRFLLATGERGIGYAPVYGSAPLSLPDFQHLAYLQQRVLLAGTEDGRKEIAIGVAVRRAVEAETREVTAADSRVAPAPPPFDPERMSAAEVDEWLRRYG